MDKTTVPKHIAMIILLVILAITVGGYALFYQSQKKIVQKDREYEILKEKAMHAEENYNDLKKKFDGATTQLTQVNKDYEVLLQKHQECKEKQEELQTKSDELQQTNDKLKKALVDAQTKLGITPDASLTENPNAHPISLLNKKEQASSAKANDENQSDIVSKSVNCPASNIVTKNASTGTWEDNNIMWWVDFTSRPLFENESVKNIFKILFDGQTIACYYALGTDGVNSWVVVKGENKNKKAFNLSEKGWTLCPTDECKSLCEKESLSDCTFSPQ